MLPGSPPFSARVGPAGLSKTICARYEERGTGGESTHSGPSIAPSRIIRPMNDLEGYADVFKGLTRWSGLVPAGYLVDFLGTLTDARFRVAFGIDPAKVGGID